MIFTIIIVGICQIVCVAGLLLAVRRYLERKQATLEARLEAALHDWIDQPAPDQPNKLAMLFDSMGAVIGSAAARSLMASLNQQAGSTANVANGVSDQLQAQSNPIMALLTGGKRGKGAALLRLAEMLGPMFNNAAAAAGNNHGTQLPLRRHRD